MVIQATNSLQVLLVESYLLTHTIEVVILSLTLLITALQRLLGALSCSFEHGWRVLGVIFHANGRFLFYLHIIGLF